MELAERLLGSLSGALPLSVALGTGRAGRPALRVLRILRSLRVLCVGIAAGAGLSSGTGVGRARHRIARAFLFAGVEAIAGSQLDLEIVQLIPLGVGALAVRDRLQFLQATARGCGLRCIHPRIIPLFGKPCPTLSGERRKTFFRKR
ncbi:MAG: hypothetical protein BGO63_19325 [Candidatus Accumulibacter sp. 66-26]|nr:MAG: hypothetical protein BGO63_19325 [Candidatus Accumulibacter sp. 66-26]